jgi:hypothetical protein
MAAHCQDDSSLEEASGVGIVARHHHDSSVDLVEVGATVDLISEQALLTPHATSHATGSIRRGDSGAQVEGRAVAAQGLHPKLDGLSRHLDGPLVDVDVAGWEEIRGLHVAVGWDQRLLHGSAAQVVIASAVVVPVSAGAAIAAGWDGGDGLIAALLATGDPVVLGSTTQGHNQDE